MSPSVKPSPTVRTQTQKTSRPDALYPYWLNMVNFGLSPEDVAYQTAHIHDNRRPALTATISVLSALSSIAVLLRLAIRWRTSVGIGADDILIVIAWV